jgi:ATP-dependent helicase HrpB
MSATLDAEPVARYLNGCPIVRSEAKLFDLSIKHQPYSPELLKSKCEAQSNNFSVRKLRATF